jgi:molybdopterin synthase catalytic subunit
MTETSDLIEITRQPLDLQRVLEHVTLPACGAEVLFVGTTRQWTGDVQTQRLEYDGYEAMALKELQRLAQQARAKWPLQAVAILHRLGIVDIGEASVAVAVGAAHRAEAFEAARWLIDELKQQVPIWKKEDYADRASQWIHPT